MIDFDFYVKGIRAIYHYRAYPKVYIKKLLYHVTFEISTQAIDWYVCMYVYTGGGDSIVGISPQNAVTHLFTTKFTSKYLHQKIYFVMVYIWMV